MKSWFVLLLSCVLLACDSRQSEPDTPEGDSTREKRPQDESGRVAEAFEAYRRAILDGDGEAAYGLVDDETHRYYAEMLGHVLDSPREQVEQLGFMDRMMVLIIRHQVEAGRLLEMDGAGLFRHAVDQGWVGKASVENLSIGQVEFDGDTATAAAMAEGRESGMTFQFRQRDGRWAMSLVDLLGQAEEAMRQAVERSGMGENEFILAVIEQASGKAPTDSVWQAVRP